MRKPIPKSTIKKTLQYYLRASMEHRAQAIASVVFLPIAQMALSVGVPFLASKVIANLIYSETAFVYFWLMAAVAVCGLFFNAIGIRSNMKMQANAMASLHRMVHERLIQRGLGFYNNQIGGKLISDALDFTNSYSTLVNNSVIKALGFASIIVSGLVLLAITSPLFAVIVLVLLMILVIWTARESRLRASLRNSRLRVYRELVAHFSDTIVNAATVKSFANEKLELSRGEKLNTKLANIRERDWTRAVTSETQRVSLIVLMQVLLIFALITLSQKSSTAIASSIFAFTYSITLTNRFFEINSITRQIEESLLQASAMTAILEESVEVIDKPGAKKLSVKSGAIDIKGISFHYPDSSSNQTIFDNITISAKPGEKIGLVGHSGGGKSTLTRLILRFEDVNDGAICIDGQDISDVTQASLREAISYVPQEPLLFHRSIGENIGYGKKNHDNKDIIESAKKAYAHDFIIKLPEGYETIVGERGVKLSGGQRQRIAIARAILKDAPIIVLDEATSALDSESEVLIQKALWELMENRTTIVIAHRLSTIQRMDRILVLDQGKIVEQGSHRELIEQGGIYKNLWKHQSGGFIED